MEISLLTDAPKHNLALMKLSAWHKSMGDDVTLNMPILPADYRYASVLFKWNSDRFIADEYGGPHLEGCLDPLVERQKPDYDLFPVDYSLGYTFRPCYNSCDFCVVPKMNHPDTKHHSIWEFHDTRFSKICLLNNNTFQDPQWKLTFEEIWDANLTVRDENGYDLRLLDDEKAEALKKTKFEKQIHFAWDRMVDEHLVRHGLKVLKKHKLNNKSMAYVLTGYNTTLEQDLHRCQILHDWGVDPYVMPYKKTGRKFQRFINLRYYRRYSKIKDAWKDYC